MSKLEFSVPDFERYLQNPTDEDREYAVDAYDHLGAFCLRQTCEAYPSVKRGSARSGFRVISRLLKFASTLYPEYAQSEEAPAESNRLREILLQSTDTPLRFARMSNKTNQEVEAYFGLIPTRPSTPDNLRDLFRFEPDTSRGTLFIADGDHFFTASSLGRSMDPEPRPDPTRQCPMIDLTKNIFWPEAVNLAADSPEVFARSLEKEDN